MAGDLEFARMVEASRHEHGITPPKGPRISEWTGEREDLANIVDALGDVRNAVLSAAGKKPPRVKPYPRPVTAAQQARSQQRLDRHRTRVARFNQLPRITPRGVAGG